jgi:hypothetical protein
MNLIGKRWKEAHIGVEGDGVVIHGVDIWKAEWQPTGEDVDLAHPAYPKQTHRYAVYVTDNDVKFAAGELSAGVWGFYVPS